MHRNGARPTRAALAALADAVTEVPLVDGTTTRFVNLDYAASAPPLASLQRAVASTMAHCASIHRGQSHLSRVSTAAYERARTIVAESTGARPDDVVDSTRKHHIEHHANLLPWRGEVVIGPSARHRRSDDAGA